MSFFTKRSSLRSSSAGSAPGPERACIVNASVLPDQQVVFSYLTLKAAGGRIIYVSRDMFSINSNRTINAVCVNPNIPKHSKQSRYKYTQELQTGAENLAAPGESRKTWYKWLAKPTGVIMSWDFWSYLMSMGMAFRPACSRG